MIVVILEITENVVETSIKSVLKCFGECVLPQNFGVPAYSRELLLQQQVKAVEMLYGHEGKLFIIYDGIYLRHEKSSNNAYERKSYSGQKKVHSCKPFTICTTNGFIIDVAGPFEGTMNDVQILKHILQDSNGLVSILEKRDVFILDRGFRDVVDYLEEKGFKILMPALKGKRKQLTTEDSNDSRFVTKFRWVVEATHGIIGQKNKLLHHQFGNEALSDAETYCKTACYIQNIIGQRLNTDNDKLRLVIGRMKVR